jgi:predicted amidohydrolase YtcJ
MNVYFTTRLGFEHLGGCILLDGSIGSYTAALEEDYEGQTGQRGVLYEKQQRLSSFVEEAHEAGVQCAFHAIGPRAIEQVLTAYERALARFPRYDHRHRIEHFEMATDQQIARARDLGLVLSMQPAFEEYWGGPDGMYASRLGARWRITNRLRSIVDRGIRLAGGSDTNVTPPEPLLGIHGAVNHPNEEQRLSVREALRMFTIDAAYAGHNETRHGSISPGKEANFVLLDADPFEVARAELRRIRVLQTWYRGRPVYSDPDAEDLPRLAASGSEPRPSRTS